MIQTADTTSQPRPHLLGLTAGDLKAGLTARGLPAFRAKQIWGWLYTRGIIDPSEMTNLSKADRSWLTTELDTTLPAIAKAQHATDGVVKWLFRLVDGHEIETVYIPEYKPDGSLSRGTLCVSSQVGCTLTCRFCHTGTQGLSRNLTAAEIVGQVWLAKRELGDFEQTDKSPKGALESEESQEFGMNFSFDSDRGSVSVDTPTCEPRKPDQRKNSPKGAGSRSAVTNIVFMGMGEPLYNIDNVDKAIRILTDADGLAFGTRRITVSTSGMVANLPRVGELGVNLAISLHAPDTATRKKIMPITNKWSVEELMAAVRTFPLKAHRRVTWEYVMLAGVNDTPEHAHALIKLIHGIPSLVNLIPFNPWPGSPFNCSSKTAIRNFAKVVESAARKAAASNSQSPNSPAMLSLSVRETRGEDILAACGQLRGETSKFNTISLDYPTVVAKYGNDKQKLRVEIKDA